MIIHTEKTDFMDRTELLIQELKSKRTFWGDIKGFIRHPISWIQGMYILHLINKLEKEKGKGNAVTVSFMEE